MMGRLYLVATPRAHVSDAEFLARISAAVDGGIDMVQLRCKDTDAQPYIRLAGAVRNLLADRRCLFLINDRPDVALAVGADGVHLGQQDISVDVARRVLPDRLIGRSSHQPADAARAVEENAAYFAVGPVWETPTKPGRRAAGLSYVRHVAGSGIMIPWFAIGGINRDTIDEVLAEGATRVAVVRAILDAPDPAEAAATLAQRLDRLDRLDRLGSDTGLTPSRALMGSPHGVRHGSDPK